MKEITLKINFKFNNDLKFFNLHINNLKFLSGYTTILKIKTDLIIKAGFSLKN